jgi:hypothetical protein
MYETISMLELIKNSSFEIKTPNGWSKFDGIKKSCRDKLFCLDFDDKTQLTATPEHRILGNDEQFHYVKDLILGFITSTNKKIIKISILDEKQEVFDLINVEKKHQYYTNNIVSHNCAFIHGFNEIWTGLYPTLSAGGSALILSTPNGTVGVGQQYYNMWTEAEAGQNDFNAIRLEWHVHPEHDQTWFEKESRQLRDQKKISQELLCDFLASGDTYLQPDDLTWLRMQITEPERKENKNRIWIWKDPVPDKRYLMSADVSRGDGKDYSAFHIFDYDDCEVVVEFMDKLPPDRLADLMIEWGKKYNDAVIVPENNSYGYLTCTKLRNENYKRLFYQSNKKDIFEILDPQPEELNGFSTQTKSRVQILSKLEEVIRNKLITVHSRRLYEQLNTFIWNNGKAQASAESYDDLVLSAAIGVWLVSDVTSLPADDKEMLYAMLRASSLERNSQSTTLSKVNEVKPFVSPAIMGSNPNSVYHPRSSEFAQKQRPGAQGLFNFNWLLR